MAEQDKRHEHNEMYEQNEMYQQDERYGQSGKREVEKRVLLNLADLLKEENFLTSEEWMRLKQRIALE